MSSDQHERLIEIFKDMLSVKKSMPDSTSSAPHADNLSFSQSPTGRQWQFTLPGLYHFCCQSNRELSEIGYREFRKLLYRYPTNRRLFGGGGQFVVVENKGHIDRNIYALIHSDQINQPGSRMIKKRLDPVSWCVTDS